MKRMTEEEVESLCRVIKSKPTIANRYDDAASKLVDEVRDNLVPQWQDEPTEEREHYVRGVHGVCSINVAAGVWMMRRLTSNGGAPLIGEDGNWEPLNGRQVCPIGARPQ